MKYASASHEGFVLEDPKRPRRYSEAAVPAHAGRDGAAVRRYSRSARRIRSRLRDAHLESSWRVRAACVSRPVWLTTEDHLREEDPRAGLEMRFQQLAKLDAPHNLSSRDYESRLQIELGVICQMGFAGLLLDRRRFYSLGPRKRRARGTGPRLGTGSLVAYRSWHHGLGSAAIRFVVRALLESRARVDARLRRGLLHGRPRSRHRIRRASAMAKSASRKSSPTARWRRRRSCATSHVRMAKAYGFRRQDREAHSRSSSVSR